MPLYEYKCCDCGHRFESFVTGSAKPSCPKCKSENLEKLLSVFGVGSPGVGKSAGGGCSPSGGG